jgi:hypothetical protein
MGVKDDFFSHGSFKVANGETKILFWEDAWHQKNVFVVNVLM